MTTERKGCDLCGDTGVLTASSKCHPNAPLRATLANGVLTLSCYVPECGREVLTIEVNAGETLFALERLRFLVREMFKQIDEEEDRPGRDLTPEEQRTILSLDAELRQRAGAPPHKHEHVRPAN